MTAPFPFPTKLQGNKANVFLYKFSPRLLYFAFLNNNRWLNITNITPHGPDDGSLEPKRYSVDFSINLSFHLDYFVINSSTYCRITTLYLLSYIYIVYLDSKSLSNLVQLKAAECFLYIFKQRRPSLLIICPLFGLWWWRKYPILAQMLLTVSLVVLRVHVRLFVVVSFCEFSYLFRVMFFSVLDMIRNNLMGVAPEIPELCRMRNTPSLPLISVSTFTWSGSTW